ncbi:MAG: hypothetical protein ACTSQL_08525 [Promethearchaeota archaeon]
MVVQKVYHCNNEIVEWKWSSDNELMPQHMWTSAFLIDGLLIDAGAPGGVDDLRKFHIYLHHKIPLFYLTL